MEIQNKAFLKDRLHLFAFFVRVVPYLGMAGVASWVGRSIGYWVPDSGRVYLMSVTWGLLIGLYIMEEEPGWNVVLLLGFALAAGTLFEEVDFEAFRGKVWSTLVFCLCLSFIGGTLSRHRIRRVGVYLFPLAILYLLGWMFLKFFPVPSAWMSLWACLGLLLFLLIGVSVFNRGKGEGGDGSPVPLASDLFVVTLNLFWLSAVFWNLVG